MKPLPNPAMERAHKGSAAKRLTGKWLTVRPEEVALWWYRIDVLQRVRSDINSLKLIVCACEECMGDPQECASFLDQSEPITDRLPGHLSLAIKWSLWPIDSRHKALKREMTERLAGD